MYVINIGGGGGVVLNVFFSFLRNCGSKVVFIDSLILMEGRFVEGYGWYLQFQLKHFDKFPTSVMNCKWEKEPLKQICSL